MEINYDTYMQLKQSGMRRAEIADALSVPDWKLKKYIANMGWGKKPPAIGYQEAFDEYTEESCYWAGFLAADGNIDSKKRIRIMLKYDDIGHLEKFRNFLKSTHTISSNTIKYYRCSFEFTNPYICEMLFFNFNIVPNKTNCLEFPSHIPDRYLKYYIRGYFDGDGSLCESFSNANSKTSSIYATFSSGSENFSSSLFVYLKNVLNLGGHLQKFNDSNKWQLKYNTNDAKTLLKYLYCDSNIHLDRKYLLYQRLVISDIRKMR